VQSWDHGSDQSVHDFTAPQFQLKFGIAYVMHFRKTSRANLSQFTLKLNIG